MGKRDFVWEEGWGSQSHTSHHKRASGRVRSERCRGGGEESKQTKAPGDLRFPIKQKPGLIAHTRTQRHTSGEEGREDDWVGMEEGRARWLEASIHRAISRSVPNETFPRPGGT